jgi:hypothetical protein
MEKTLENRFSMYRSVQAVLRQHYSSIEPIKKFTDEVDQYVANLEIIKTKQEEREQANLTEDKNELEDQLMESLIVNAAALKIVANFNGNEKLKQESDFSKSDLKVLRDSDLVVKGQQIVDNLNKHLPNPADYGLDENSTATLTELVSSFEKILGDSAARKASKVAAKQEQQEAFKNIKVNLDNLDSFVEILSSKSPELYNDYKQARVIKNL